MSKMIDKFVDKAIELLSQYKDRREVQSYINGIRSSYSKLANKKTLSKEQEKEIQEYYKNLIGHEVPLDWHRYFYARTGVYSKLFVPTSEYKTNVVTRLNVFPFKRAYTNKNVMDLLLPNSRFPKIYLKNMNGYYYMNGGSLSKEDALAACGDLGTVIIKPCLKARGNGVRKIKIENGMTDFENKSLLQVFDLYKKNFMLQEVIKQHPRISALNPTSINSLRILTYRKGMDVYVLYSVIRIGRSGMAIDNESAGGISTVVHSDGTLGKYAYGSPGVDKVEYTDSGVKLEGYEIPSYQKVIDYVKQQHYYLPYFNIVGWDMTVDEAGEPMMIEYNVTPDLSQSANGPAFGDYTEMIIKDAMAKPNTYSKLLEMDVKKGNS